MKITKGPRKFYCVEGAPPKVLTWIRYSVPQKYRYYKDNAWYVHVKHIDEVQQLGSAEGVTPTPSGSDDYAILHLRTSAPMAIVDASFRALAKLHHPDVGGDEETFKKLSAAYQRIKYSRRTG